MKRTTCIIVGSLFLRVGGGGCGEEPYGGNDNDNNNVNENNPMCCGDGNVDPGESCDDGSANSDTQPDACRTDCRSAYCSDGVVDSGEECDGEGLNGKDCTDFGSFTHGELSCNDGDCTFDTSQCGTCGDGEAEGAPGDPHYETCDGSDLRGEDCISIGQAQGVLRCNGSCGWDISGCVGGGTTCGDGNLEPGEQCDDGNTTACDGCSPTCIVEACGNGVMECSEQCDDGNSSNEDFCLANCTLNTCGDGHVDPSTEECDDGNHDLNDACPDGPLGTCLNASCGDGFVQAGVEGCDDGNSSNVDNCPDGIGGSCELATCGDGFVQAGVEICDEAADPTCHLGCTNYCGDGVVGHPTYELCDDSISCSADCQRFCGDGVIDTDLGEVCDDFHSGYPYDPTYGPLGDNNNPTGGRSATCLQNCQPSTCGDGICNMFPDSNETTYCLGDCPCADQGRIECGGICCPFGWNNCFDGVCALW